MHSRNRSILWGPVLGLIINLFIPSLSLSAEKTISIGSGSLVEDQIVAQIIVRHLQDNDFPSAKRMKTPVDSRKALKYLKSGELGLYVVNSDDIAASQLKNRKIVVGDLLGSSRLLGAAGFVNAHPETWRELNQLKEQLSSTLVRHLVSLVADEKKSIEDVAEIYIGSSHWIRLAKEKNNVIKPPLKGRVIDSPELENDYFKNLWVATKEHFALVLTAVFVILLIAFPLGILASVIPWVGLVLTSMLSLLMTLPALVFICFIVPFLGTGWWPSVWAVCLGGVAPLTNGIHQGLERTHFKSSGFQKFQVRNFFEQVVPSLRKSVVICVGLAGLAAFIGAGGYGRLIVRGLTLNDYPALLEGALQLSLATIFVRWLFDLCEWVFKLNQSAS